MKVMVLLDSLYTGGAEFSTLTFYSWLLKQGYFVKLVCYKKATPSYSWSQFGFGELTILKGDSFIQKLRSFNEIVRDFCPDIVHSVLFQANILGRFSRYTNNFVHVESLITEMYSNHRLANPGISRLKLETYRVFDFLTQLQGVDHFHSNGESVAHHYRRKLRIRSSRITIIPRGRPINPLVGNSEVRTGVRNELGTGNRLLLIHVASHGYPKAHDVLLKALHLMGSLARRFQVLLVGREGTQTQSIRKYIETFNLRDTVLILGHRTDVSSLLAAADIFVFPSRLEGLPGALIEAESAGLPIVCSDIQNNREVAEANVNALFFKSGDAGELAERLDTLSKDTEMRVRFAENSQRIFMERFLIDSIHERMLLLLKRLNLKK